MTTVHRVSPGHQRHKDDLEARAAPRVPTACVVRTYFQKEEGRKMLSRTIFCTLVTFMLLVFPLCFLEPASAEYDITVAYNDSDDNDINDRQNIGRAGTSRRSPDTSLGHAWTQYSRTVLHDDFDDNDISDWQNSDWAGTSRPSPDISGGIISGQDSGHGGPTDPGSWAFKDIGATDVTQGFRWESRAVSGSGWPNFATAYLADDWGTVADMYQIRIYGEGNRRLDLLKYDMGTETYLGTYSLGPSVHDWQTYAIERDALGEWTLYIDGVEQTRASFTPDMTHTRFTHVGLEMLKSGSKFDEVELSVTPDSSPLGVLGLTVLPLGIYVGSEMLKSGSKFDEVEPEPYVTPELPPSALLGLSMLPLGIAYLRGRRRKQS